MRTERWQAAACAAAALLAPCSPAAGADSPWHLGLETGLRSDSNLLRVAEGQPVPAGLSAADRVATATLQAGAGLQLGRQRVQVQVALGEHRHARNPRFDHTSHAAAVALDWATAARLSGRVWADRRRALADFGTNPQALQREPTLEDRQDLGATLRLGGDAAWSTALTVARHKLTLSPEDSAGRLRGFLQHGEALGLYWQPGAGARLGLALGQTHRQGPAWAGLASAGPGPGSPAADDRPVSLGLGLSLWLQPTGASTVALWLSPVRTRQDRQDGHAAFDDQGLAGSLAWDWRATGKTRLRVTALRERALDGGLPALLAALRPEAEPMGPPAADPDAPDPSRYSRLTHTVQARVAHEASARVGATLAVSVAWRDLRGLPTAGLPGAAATTGRDRTARLAIAAHWAPARGLRLSCNAFREARRGARGLGSDLQAHGGDCSVQLSST